MIRKVIIIGLTLLSVATLVVAACSFIVPIRQEFDWPPRSMAVRAERGCISVALGRYTGNFKIAKFTMRTRLADTKHLPVSPWLPGTTTHNQWGHNSEGTRIFNRQTFTMRVVTCPLWILLLVFSSYPAIAFIRGPLRRRRRRKRGLCIHCGYSLTGLPESRCPECGTAIESV